MDTNTSLFKTTAILLLLAILGFDMAEARRKVQPTDYDTYKIRDLALIYQGNNRRLDWTVEDFVPYVSHKFADGHRDWTFDGFMFLEADNGADVTFYPSIKKMGTKADWQWYLDKLFAEGLALDALDMCIDSLKTELGDPGFKHKVVLTILIPCLKTENWGEIDGKPIDMSKYDQAALASKWYIDQLVGRFKARKYKNLELTGLYWLDEDLCHTFDLPKYIEPIVHGHDLDYIWIPYFNARGIGSWREQGFDMVYLQPNYLFDPKISRLRLKDSTDYARGLSIGMELEFDHTSLSDFNDGPNSYQRLRDYIDWFRDSGVWDRSGVAYYTGSKAIKLMAESTNPRDHEIMDELFSIIVGRRSNPKLIKKDNH